MWRLAGPILSLGLADLGQEDGPAKGTELGLIAFVSFGVHDVRLSIPRCRPTVYVMNADGTGVVQLTDGPSGDVLPAWSPDGAAIVFVSGRGGNFADLYVMNADGSGLRRLTDDPGEDIDPSWSIRAVSG